MSAQSDTFLTDALVFFVLLLYADLLNETRLLLLSIDALSLSFAASLVAKQAVTFWSIYFAKGGAVCAYAIGTWYLKLLSVG